MGSLVSVCVVVVVLDPPGLKWVYERSKHQGTHNVLNQLVLTEGSVTTIMTNHKELQKPHTVLRHLLLQLQQHSRHVKVRAVCSLRNAAPTCKQPVAH